MSTGHIDQNGGLSVTGVIVIHPFFLGRGEPQQVVKLYFEQITQEGTRRLGLKPLRGKGVADEVSTLLDTVRSYRCEKHALCPEKLTDQQEIRFTQV